MFFSFHFLKMKGLGAARPVFSFLLLLVVTTVCGQNFKKDTLRLTLPQAEKAFLDSNLLLLAQKYNIDAQKALIIQAKLWPNPNLSLGHGPIVFISYLSSLYPHSSFFNTPTSSAPSSHLLFLST